jgi:alpha-1,6-mannosyltransferase
VTPETGKTKQRTNWKDKLTSEFAYTLLICLTIFLYIVLALLALAPDGTVGKLSPIQDAVQRNSYLSKVLDFTGIGHMTNHQLILVFWVLVLLILLAYAWAVYFFRVRQDKGLFSILALTVLICALLIVIPPLVSKDTFSNIFYGKIAARYHDNPYLITPQRFSGDQLMAYTSLNWKNTAIVYGPLHTYFSMLLNLLAGQSITSNIMVFKGAMAFFHLANIILIWLILGSIAPRRQRWGTLIYAWNPISLVIGVGGGHNDLMMMTLILMGLLFLLKEKRWPGYIFLVLSVFIKYISIVLLMALVIYFLYEKDSWRERLHDLALYAAIFLLIGAILFLPFWAGFKTFDSTLHNLQLKNLMSIGGLLGTAFYGILRYVLRIPPSFAKAAGQVLAEVLLLPFFLFTLWWAPRKAREARDIPNMFFFVTLAYLLTTSYYMPWYMIWLLPFIAMRPWDRLTKYSLGIGTATIYLGCDVRPY